MPRWSLALVASLHAAVFTWAGSKLPWSDWSGFAVACYALALAHALTAIAAVLRLRALIPIWRVGSVLGLCMLAYLAWQLTSSAAYLSGLYGELGKGIGAALLAVVALAALPTLPLSCWGLAMTWPSSKRVNVATVSAAPVLLMMWTLGALHQAEAAHAQPLPLPGEFEPGNHLHHSTLNAVVEIELFETIARDLDNWGNLPEIPIDGPIRKVQGGYRHAKLRVPSLMTAEPIDCVPKLDEPWSVAVVTYLKLLDDPPEKPKVWAPVEVVSRCIRAAPEHIAADIVAQLRAESVRGPVKIDLIRAVAPLHSRSPILDTLALQPGLDGVCDESHCLMPWQLVALEQFNVNEPLPWIPDFRYGISPVELRHVLGWEVPEDVLAWDREQRHPARLERLIEAGKATPKPADVDSWLLLDGLTRIETLSYAIVDNGHFHALVRVHPREVRLTQRRLDHALELADNHIAKAQLDSGVFRYTLQPFTGKQQTRSWNLPRQAGTTLVMCELGREPRRTKRVADQSLRFMAKHARDSGEVTALIKSKTGETADLGSTALPAIAFLSCRERVGDGYDELIGGMVRFLLTMQRDDGSFYPQFDTAAGAIIDGPEPMYAGGQAIFALTLAEKLALEQPDVAAAAGLPDAATLHDAVERAMGFYTGPYWDTFVRDFFWLEENWHCLAARASLGHHRNDAYERYCIDYMTYKSRVVLDEHSGVEPDFVGSYAMGNILVPVNTPAAGFGEGLAAALAIKQARGDDISEDLERMRSVLMFLMRQQWTRASCFACAPDKTVLGGFSESMGAPEIRIDFTQHAWAALGHGGAFLYDDLPATMPGDL